MLEDWRRLELVHHGREQVIRSRWSQDKGHRREWQAFSSSIREGRQAPIPFEEIVASTLATLRAEQSRATGQSLPVDVKTFITLALDSRSGEESCMERKPHSSDRIAIACKKAETI